MNYRKFHRNDRNSVQDQKKNFRGSVFNVICSDVGIWCQKNTIENCFRHALCMTCPFGFINLSEDEEEYPISGTAQLLRDRGYEINKTLYATLPIMSLTNRKASVLDAVSEVLNLNDFFEDCARLRKSILTLISRKKKQYLLIDFFK